MGGVGGRRKVDDIGTDEVQLNCRRADQSVMAQYTCFIAAAVDQPIICMFS